MTRTRVRVPRSKDDDYTQDAAATRRAFVKDRTGVELDHVGSPSFEPSVVQGNIENFMGVVQMPLGLAGPLLVNGEHAKGEFFIPLATTEGTLVASYSRGMRVLTESGGVTTTVLESFMQRAPVFIFSDARQALAFGEWVVNNFDQIKAAADSTTHFGRLHHIEQYGIARMRYLRFNYTTGDAAGQNMCGKATLVACEWIMQNCPHPIGNYILSGNIDTDKKHSALNLMRTRGKRVVAEATIPREVLENIMRVDPETLFRSRQLSNVGAIMAGSAFNGAHAANGIAALLIATGQDEANVAESHAGIVFSDITDDGDYYWSVTLPSLIVATTGGGTGLPTQRECLEILGCYGTGKVNKLAELFAATVLAGEISLSCAVLAGDWVTSHDALGRNRQ